MAILRDTLVDFACLADRDRATDHELDVLAAGEGNEGGRPIDPCGRRGGAFGNAGVDRGRAAGLLERRWGRLVVCIDGLGGPRHCDDDDDVCAAGLARPSRSRARV